MVLRDSNSSAYTGVFNSTSTTDALHKLKLLHRLTTVTIYFLYNHLEPFSLSDLCYKTPQISLHKMLLWESEHYSEWNGTVDHGGIMLLLSSSQE